MLSGSEERLILQTLSGKKKEILKYQGLLSEINQKCLEERKVV